MNNNHDDNEENEKDANDETREEFMDVCLQLARNDRLSLTLSIIFKKESLIFYF